MEERDRRSAVVPHGISLNVPPLPRVKLFAVLIVRQPVVIHNYLRAGGDGEVVDQRTQRGVAGLLDVVQDVRQAVAHRGTGNLLEAGDVVGVALARRRRELNLDDVLPDDPCLHEIIAQRVGDQFLFHARFKQQAALHVARELEAVDQPRLVHVGIFAGLLHGALGIRLVDVFHQPAPAVEVKHRPDGFGVVTRQIEEVVQVSPSQARALDDRGVLDVADTGRPPDVERRDARPGKLGRLFDGGLVTFPGNHRQDADDRTLDAGKGEQRQVGDELRQRLVEPAFLEDLVELVLGDAGALLSTFLRCLPGSLHELHGALADSVNVRRLTYHLHRLHLELHKLVHRCHDLRRDFRVVAGVQTPWAIRREVDVPQQR